MAVNKKRIIVTGASGLIGHGILNILKGNKNFQIYGIYNQNKPTLKSDNIHFIKEDLSKKDAWRHLLERKADVLIHAAAKVPSGDGTITFGSAKKENIHLDQLAVKYAAESKNTFIYLSGTSVYGMVKEKNCYEDSTTLAPRNEYIKAKVTIEELILNNAQFMKFFIFRISSVYGSGKQRLTVLNKFIQAALTNKPLLYYGSGERRQDFINVDDVGRACLKALDSRAYGIYNIASGESVSMINLANIIKSLTSSKSVIGPKNVVDLEENNRPIINIQKAKDNLSWQPDCNFENSLKKFINSLKKENM